MKSITDRLTVEDHHGTKIVFVDYTGLKEQDMITLVNNHLELTLKARLPFIADFHQTFATPGYLKHGHHFVASTKSIIAKGAFLGIDPVKAWILKGILMTYGVNYRAFNTKEEAIGFLMHGPAVKQV